MQYKEWGHLKTIQVGIQVIHYIMDLCVQPYILCVYDEPGVVGPPTPNLLTGSLPPFPFTPISIFPSSAIPSCILPIHDSSFTPHLLLLFLSTFHHCTVSIHNNLSRLLPISHISSPSLPFSPHHTPPSQTETWGEGQGDKGSGSLIMCAIGRERICDQP